MSDVVWSLPKRIAFRFGFCLAVLFVYPAPFGMIPKTDTIAEWLGKPWEWLVVWFCQTVLGDTPPIQPTGSGDTLFGWTNALVMLIVAALATIVWSTLDRKRLAYPRLAAATWVVLRYTLAFAMFTYGFAKIINTQFPAPSAARFDERLGEMSPMGMLWTFQGASQPYTMFGGFCEALAATLLLWRRTATLGALVAAAVLTNVVMLNFCYDVPVKLYSSQLLTIAILIAYPQLRRLLLTALGHAAPEVPPRARSSVRVERARLALKVAVIGIFAHNVRAQVIESIAYRGHANELSGIWTVTSFRENGVEQPALVTNERRWCKLVVTEWSVRAKNCADVAVPLSAQVMPAAQAILINDTEPQTHELWRYHRDGDQLVIDAGARHVTLTRMPAPLLVTRGFHWVQEFPFNR